MGSSPSFGRHTCERRYRPESPRWVIPRPRNSMGNSDSSSSPEGWLTSGGSGATRQLQDHVWVPGTNPLGQRAGARQAAPRPAAAAAAAAGASAAAGARRCRSRSCQGGCAIANFISKWMTFVVRQNSKKSWFCEKCRSCYNLIHLKTLRWIQTR